MTLREHYHTIVTGYDGGDPFIEELLREMERRLEA